MAVPKNHPDHPVVFGIQADTTDEELDELAEVVVEALDQQAADHRRGDKRCAE